MYLRAWIGLIEPDEEVLDLKNGRPRLWILGLQIDGTPTITCIPWSAPGRRWWGGEHQLHLLVLDREQRRQRGLLNVLLSDCTREVEHGCFDVCIETTSRDVFIYDGYGNLNGRHSQTIAWVAIGATVLLL